MNFIDILVAVVILWFSYKGFNKGLVVEITGLLAFLLGIYGGMKFSYILSDYLAKDVEESYLPLISFSLTFILIVIVVFLLGKMVERVVNAASLKLINKLAGAIFGGLKVAAIFSIAFTIFEGYDNKLHFVKNETKKNSILYYPMLELGDLVLPELERRKIINEEEIKPEINVLDILDSD